MLAWLRGRTSIGNEGVAEGAVFELVGSDGIIADYVFAGGASVGLVVLK